MKPIALLLTLLVLAACGADGAPTAPETGVTVTGQVKIGVSGS